MNNNQPPDFSANMSMDAPQGMQQAPKRSVDVNSDYGSQVSNIERRLRMLEERYNSMQKRAELTEENMLLGSKKVSVSLKTITSETADIRVEITQIKEKIELMIEELRQSAKKQEIKVVESYLELWDPSQFVTQKDIENLVRREVAKNIESFKKE